MNRHRPGLDIRPSGPEKALVAGSPRGRPEEAPILDCLSLLDVDNVGGPEFLLTIVTISYWDKGILSSSMKHRTSLSWPSRETSTYPFLKTTI